MFSVKLFIQFSIMSSVMLLPVAHLKVLVFGLPLYSVEAPILIASLAYVYGWLKGISLPLRGVNFRNPFVIGITFFFFGALLSFVANPFSWTGLGMLKTWFVFPILMLWLWTETKPEESDLRRLLLVWLSISMLSAMVSLVYFWQGALTYDGRLAAWYGSPNYLAFFLSPSILIASYFLSFPPFIKRNIFIFFWLALIVLSATIFLTGSYAALVSTLGALAVYFYLSYDPEVFLRQKFLFAVLLLCLFTIFIFWESDSEKWQSLITLSERSSLASRVMIWRTATKMISDYSLLGIGIGRFQEVYLAYQKYFPFYLEWAVPQPHNLYLAVWLQTGIMGLFGFCFLIAVWLRKTFLFWRSSVQSGYIKKTSALLIALTALFLLIGIMDTPFFKTDLVFIFWIILMLGIGFLNQKRRSF